LGDAITLGTDLFEHREAKPHFINPVGSAKILRRGSRRELMDKSSGGVSPPRLFRAGRYWNSNVFGAALAGGLGGVLMLVIMCLMIWLNPAPHVVRFAAAWALGIAIPVLCLLPGNMIAAYPYAVSVHEGKGLELYAPLKRLYIPIEDIRDVRKTYLQPGYIVSFKRRHRLLKGFLIPWFFGDQAEPLANAIREEIRRLA
jgi:hypothetical protein